MNLLCVLNKYYYRKLKLCGHVFEMAVVKSGKSVELQHSVLVGWRRQMNKQKKHYLEKKIDFQFFSLRIFGRHYLNRPVHLLIQNSFLWFKTGRNLCLRNFVHWQSGTGGV